MLAQRESLTVSHSFLTADSLPTHCNLEAKSQAMLEKISLLGRDNVDLTQ